MVPTSQPQALPKLRASQIHVPGATTHLLPGKLWDEGVCIHGQVCCLIHKSWLLGPFEARTFECCLFGAGSSSLLKEIRWCDMRGYRKYSLLHVILVAAITSTRNWA